MVDPGPKSESKSSWLPQGTFHRVAFVVLALLVVLLLGVIFFGWLKDFLIFGTFNFAVRKFVDATGMSVFLVKGILVIVLIPFFVALREIAKIPLFKRVGRLSKPVAYGIVACYISAYFLAMYFATKDTYFHHTGDKVVATKYFAITPEGIRYFDTPGIDPKYGIPLKPATPEMVANEERRKRGIIPRPLSFRSLSEIAFFDPLNGQPQVWFSRSPSGELSLFSSPGYDSATMQELSPVTPQIVEELRQRQQSAEAKKQAEERQAQEAAKSEAAESEKAQSRAQEDNFRNKYVNTMARSNSPQRSIAPLILGDIESAGSLQDSVSSALKERGIASVDGLFKPEFIRDGTAAQFFGGDLALARRLHLNEKVESILLVRSTHKTASAEELGQGFRTVTLNLDMKCVDVVSLRISGSRSVSVKGVGFSDSEALRESLRNAGPEIQNFVKSVGI